MIQVIKEIREITIYIGDKLVVIREESRTIKSLPEKK